MGILSARLGAHVPRPPAAPIKGLAAGGRGACAQRTPAASFGGVSVTPPPINTSTRHSTEGLRCT